jgi:catechol 2,3-dioxygenase-like lactoylglutathione lyase family enzyme
MTETVQLRRAVPILRMFSVEKAREFYLDFLGFKIDWEHRFEEGLPLYMQVSRGGLTLHLSEHHGDGSPGASVLVEMRGLDAFHREITDRQYRYARPGIVDAPWNARYVRVIDPCGNTLTFNEQKDGP